MKLNLVYFSPTNTTKKIISAIGKVFFEKTLSSTKIIDLTSLAARVREYDFSEEDVVIFGAPVYGGRIPQLLVPVLKKFSGNGARAVIVSVYGNRDYDDALLETYNIFSEQGFLVCAAAAFIGEHSYSEKVGGGRPDSEDILAAQTFAHIAATKVAGGFPIQKKIKGSYPYKELSKGLSSARKAPKINENCVHCGKCITVCPVCNIAADLKDRGKCIGCAACVKICPQKARSFGEDIQAIKEKLENNFVMRKTPEFFI